MELPPILVELPLHMDVAEPATGLGNELTVTLVEPAALVHPLIVTFTEYEPALEEVADVILGFCDDELKLFGPVHE